MPSNGRPRTSIAHVDATSVTIRGLDLTDDMLGRMSFTEAALLDITGKRPSEAEVALTDLVLVCLMEHGMMPANIAARLTYRGAPEAFQAAVASGLCGVGSVLLGAVEGCAEMLQDGLARAEAAGADLDAAAREIVQERRAAGRKIPGLGHTVHFPEDPRTDRLFEVAEEWGYGGRHIALLQAVGRAADEAIGRHLPINADGACGAILANLGLDWRIARGFALIARSAGLVAHLWEEMRQPAAPALLEQIESGVDYEPLTG
jgi:citrate synthase